jgi:hypothetical protein
MTYGGFPAKCLMPPIYATIDAAVKTRGRVHSLRRRQIHIAPAYRCPTNRDFLPWRFSDAGRKSAWMVSAFRRPKTCTARDIQGAHAAGRCNFQRFYLLLD